MSKEKRKPEEELKAIIPDLDVEVGDPDSGERIIVCVAKLRALQGWKARPLLHKMAKPICDAVTADDPDEGMMQVIADHAQDFLYLLTLSTGKDTEFLERLDAQDMMVLTDALWSVNSDFFMGVVLKSKAGRETREMLLASQESSMNSSGQDTAADAPAESWKK